MRSHWKGNRGLESESLHDREKRAEDETRAQSRRFVTSDDFGPPAGQPTTMTKTANKSIEYKKYHCFTFLNLLQPNNSTWTMADTDPLPVPAQLEAQLGKCKSSRPPTYYKSREKTAAVSVWDFSVIATVLFAYRPGVLWLLRLIECIYLFNFLTSFIADLILKPNRRWKKPRPREKAPKVHYY